jgi:hypothetical protein
MLRGVHSFYKISLITYKKKGSNLHEISLCSWYQAALISSASVILFNYSVKQFKAFELSASIYFKYIIFLISFDSS